MTRWLALYFFAAVWLVGWIAIARSVEMMHFDSLWLKIGTYMILFFIWPYIVFCHIKENI